MKHIHSYPSILRTGSPAILNYVSKVDNQQIIVRVADPSDSIYSSLITDEMESSAKARGTGIAKRSPDYITQKMQEGKAVIAVTTDGTWVGFCYIETWEGEYVANSGLIVSPPFRKTGIAKNIKQRIFQLSREKYPDAKIFGLTTGLAVMKINSDLGYEPVTYSELTKDEKFWAGCRSCVNFDILTQKERKNCLCTAMLYDPQEHRQAAAGTAQPAPDEAASAIVAPDLITATLKYVAEVTTARRVQLHLPEVCAV